MSVAYDECEYTRFVHKLVCAYKDLYTSTVDFIPRPIYSGQCRNEVAVQFIPVIIASAGFQAFVVPLVYFYYTAKITDLNGKYDCIGIKCSGRTLVLPMLQLL